MAVTAPVAPNTTSELTPTQTVARRARTTTTIDDETTPLAASVEDAASGNVQKDADVVIIEDEEVPLAVIEDDENADTATTTIEDEAVAQAESIENPSHNFLWWLVALLAAITGKTGYDKKNNKGIFKPKNPDNQKK